jgi:PPOX class probable F420-dependent enzyme
VPVALPDELLDLLGRPSLCFVATIMPDGSPQLTQTWVSTDGEHILINTPDHSQKARNVARDPRLAVNVADPGNTRRYFAVRGRVIATTTEGGAQSIEEVSGKYLGRPYIATLEVNVLNCRRSDGWCHACWLTSWASRWRNAGS